MLLKLGRRIAPLRFLSFAVGAIAASALLWPVLGAAEASMAGFDLAALGFLLSCIPLLDDRPIEMRSRAIANDANRPLLLVVTAAVIGVVLVSVSTELAGQAAPDRASTLLIIATLALAWLFSNAVYALHYAHLYYSPIDGTDRGGIDVPDTDEPTYWDFVYFAFTLGMTFQTSDVTVRSTAIRRVVIAHCLAAFVFNIGVLAFSINILGGGH